MCVVSAAHTYADADGDGSGYHLVLTLTNGRVLRGASWAPKDGVLRMTVLDEDGETKEVFVAISTISTVEVEF